MLLKGLIEGRGSLCGPQKLDVWPLSLEAALDGCVICTHHGILEAQN